MQPANHPKKRLLGALLIFGLPLLIIGIILLILLNKHPGDQKKAASAGAFNPQMPAPNLQKGEKNKLELYMDAEKDSLRRQQALHSDPYAKTAGALPLDSVIPVKGHLTPGIPQRSFGSGPVVPVDTNERKVNEHLAKLYAAMRSTPASPGTPDGSPPAFNPAATSLPGTEVDRLERLEAGLRHQDTSTNPQLQQINTLLDKVLAIQHPERLAASNPPSGGKTSVFPVSASAPDSNRRAEAPDNDAAAPATGYDESNNAFYGLSGNDDAPAATAASIRAVIHADQKVQSGSVVKLRLLQDIYVKGVRIPANSFIFGPCSISNERVTVHLSQVQFGGMVYPIDMKVLDGADGLEGLYVPGAISRDVIKEGAGQGVSSLGLANLDPSLGAQAAAAGIETAKTLFTRKIQLITATLKAGHLAILEPGQ